MKGTYGASPARIMRVLLTAGLLSCVGSDIGLTFNDLKAVPLIATPEMPRPDYLQPTRDPSFGTPFIRVTDPSREILPKIACNPGHCRHRYSSTQAWNADQTLLVIHKGCPGLCFLDGHDYRPLFQRRPSGTCEWHPFDPEQMICVSKDKIYRWWVRNGDQATIYAPREYANLEFGPGKNNLSWDGNRLVVRATTSSGRLIAFPYDIRTATKFPDIRLDRLDGDNHYCTISPSGEYTLCYQEMPDKTDVAYIFTVDGSQVQHWAEHHRPGHGDMMIDSDGSDVYVGISKSDPDKYQIIKRRLSDGVVTVLTPRGPAQHASVRSIKRPGWVFITYGGSYERAASRRILPLYGEIVALRTDGSGEIRRIVHHRSAKHNYLSEAHGSPSPDGSQVIWASNWGQPGAPVAAYVARLSWPDEAQGPRPQRGEP